MNSASRIFSALACSALVASCSGGFGDDFVTTPGTPTPAAPGAVSVSLFAGALQSAGSRDGIGAAAQLNGPADVAQDAAGNAYVTDTGNHTIRKIAPDGTVTTFAGTAGQAGSADGTGASARFRNPGGIAVDAAGNVLVSDTGNSTLRRISPSGVVTTIAGVAGESQVVDGAAATARLGAPGSIAVDASGTIYFVDGLSVRKRALDASITTFAGNANEQAPSANGNGAQTRFVNTPLSVAVDGGGNVYIAEGSVFAINASGSIRKFDSQAQALPFGTSANGVLALPYPSDIATDAAGNVYVVSNGIFQPVPSFSTVYRTLQQISPDGRVIITLAGGSEVRTVDGPSADARFTDPHGLAVGPNGRIVVAETSTNAIRLVNTQQGVVSTLAGGSGGGDVDGALTAARFNAPQGIAAAPDGTLYVADRRNHSVRKITTAGVVSTLARNASWSPQAVAVAGNSGTVYAMESPFSPVGRVINTIAPNGTLNGFGNGPTFATLAGFSPTTLAADAAGNVYVVDNTDVVVLSPTGRRVLASGLSVSNLAVDPSGNVYFTSTNNVVGVIDQSGVAAIRAGAANQAGDTDGSGQSARFNNPTALAVDAAGNMYIAERTKIRKVSPQGTVTTIADVTTVTGGQPGFAASSITTVNGLAWSNGALYATVLNAVIRIAQ